MMAGKRSKNGDYDLPTWNQLARRANYNAKALARECSISVRHLERSFRARFGYSPQVWLNRLRLSDAKEMLQKGMRVKEAAFSLGFKQLSHFSRDFKKFAGLTPTEFSARYINVE